MPAAPTLPTRRRVGRAYMAAVGIESTPQFEAPLFDTRREVDVSGAQQAGKSFNDAARVWVDVPFAPWHEANVHPGQPCRYWFILPSFESKHTEIDYLAAWSLRLGIRDSYSARGGGPCSLSMLGGRIQVATLTGRKPEAIAGEPCCGVIVVEAGQQSSDVDEAIQTRIAARHGWARKSGTLEDDEANRRWAWYGEQLQAWLDDPTEDHAAYTLPMWANPLYGGDEHHPEIERLRARLDPYTFGRRVAGLPMGNPNPMYPIIQPLERRDHYLRPLPWAVCLPCSGSGLVDGRTCYECAGIGRVLPWRWVDAVGGIDFGDVHPSAVVAVTINELGDAWLRACIVVQGGDADAIARAKTYLTQRYGAARWGLDPLQRWVANMSGENTVAVSLGAGSRSGRIGMLRSMINAGHFFWDAEGEGVIEAFEETRAVHYVKNAAGELVHPRIADDRTAATEDAVEVYRGPQSLPLDLGALRASDGPDAKRLDPFAFEDAKGPMRDPRMDPIMASFLQQVGQ